MIIVHVEIDFAEAIFLNPNTHPAFAAMESATREEPGCLKYVSSIDVHDARVLRIYEEWASMEQLEPHFATQHMATFQAALSGLKSVSMTAKVYDVSGELPFPNR